MPSYEDLKDSVEKRIMFGHRAADGKFYALATDELGNLQMDLVASLDIDLDPSSANAKGFSLTITATTYPGTAQAVFGFTSRGFAISNDSSQDVTYSINGTTDLGIVKAYENHDWPVQATQITFKIASGSSAIRVQAW